MTTPHLTLLTSADWRDYELLDSGDLKKLERFGDYRFIRPEPQAIWQPRLGNDAWLADGVFQPDKNNTENNESGGWHLSKNLPFSWQMRYQNLRFMARPTPFRHLGFFPEQAAHWNWCAKKIQQFQKNNGRCPRILNLFAYSGLASLHAAAAGAEVTHVDASRKAIAQAFENRDVCGFQDAPIRFITDDASGFVAREIRRQRAYDGIIMDPPKYGRGPKGETWRIEEDLRPLLSQVINLLSGQALFLVLTIYAIRASSLAAHYALADLLKGRAGSIEAGELVIEESALSGLDTRRYISQANFARWAAYLPR
tara:strand:+ start:497 stop:1429 length:933 start_codon:yes stop_codon:yes gene_type:complete